MARVRTRLAMCNCVHSKHFEVRRTKMLNQNRKRLPALIERMDKDGDGKLTKTEFPEAGAVPFLGGQMLYAACFVAPIRQRFDEFDANKDGAFSAGAAGQQISNPCFLSVVRRAGAGRSHGIHQGNDAKGDCRSV